MTDPQLAAQFRKCQERLKELRGRADYLPLECALFRGEGPEPYHDHPDPFAVTLANSVAISAIQFDNFDGMVGYAFYTDADGATKPACQRALDRVAMIANEFVRLLRQLPSTVQRRLALPDRSDWWRILFHLAWRFPRPFFRAPRMRLLTDDGQSFEKLDETSVQMIGTKGRRDLYPGVIYSDFQVGNVAPDLCDCLDVAIDVVLSSLEAESRPDQLDETAFRILRRAFRAASNSPPGFGIDLKLLRLGDSFTTRPATQRAGLESGGTTEYQVLLSRSDEMQEICLIRGPSTASFVELAKQGGTLLPKCFDIDPVLFFAPHLDQHGYPVFVKGDPVGCQIGGVTLNPDPIARWVRFVVNVLKSEADPILKIEWDTTGNVGDTLLGNALATLHESNIFAASVVAIDVVNLVPEIDDLTESEAKHFPKPASGTLAINRDDSIVLAWINSSGEKVHALCDGILVDGPPSNATWLPSNWTMRKFPAGWTPEHVERWFQYVEDVAHPPMGLAHAYLLCEHLNLNDPPFDTAKNDIHRILDVSEFVRQQLGKPAKLPRPPLDVRAEVELDPTPAGAPPLSKPRQMILASLLKHYPKLRTIEQIVGDQEIGYSDRTIGPELRKLIEDELVVRPDGGRRGATLTPKGKALAEAISPKSEPTSD